MKLAIVSVSVALIAGCIGTGLMTSLQTPPPLKGMSSDPSVGAILGRACEDCHSNQTSWPWYSRLPRIGAAIHKDVEQGRARMNLSRWAQYGPSERDEVLAEIAALIRNRQMPPARYLLLHPRARLSASDVRRLTGWTLLERRRIRAAAAGRNAGGE